MNNHKLQLFVKIYIVQWHSWVSFRGPYQTRITAVQREEENALAGFSTWLYYAVLCNRSEGIVLAEE